MKIQAHSHHRAGTVLGGLACCTFVMLSLLFPGEPSRAFGEAFTPTPASINYLPLVANPYPPGTPSPSPVPTNTPTPATTSTQPSPTNTPTPTGTATPSGAYEYYLTGNPANTTAATTAGLMLMGGGTDVDDAFAWMIGKSGGGDFVVIRASGSNGYNNYIFSELGGVDSVETLVILDRAAASDPFVVNIIANAEALFIAGGDQWDYVSLWKGTLLEDAIHSLSTRNVPIGGTSAGLAILGEFLFSAQNGTVYSSEALEDPYNVYMTLERGFLTLPNMAGTITDSHFVERNRMGRLVAFLARLVQDGWAAEARGIGVDEETAILVEADGSAALVGSGAAYFLRSPGIPEVCQPGTPLSYLNVTVYRLSAGAAFNLISWSGSGGTAYEISAVNGVLSSTQPGGGIY